MARTWCVCHRNFSWNKRRRVRCVPDPGGGAPFGVPSPWLAPIPLACSERPGLLLPHKKDQKPSPSPSVSGFLALGGASSGAVCPAELELLLLCVGGGGGGLPMEEGKDCC